MTTNFFAGTNKLKLIIGLALAGITLAVYWPAQHFDLILYDDPLFIISSGAGDGLNWNGLTWVMTGVAANNWHPITNFSFLLMHQFFGLNPGAEHLVNAIFHSANAVLLFFVLTQLTGAIWRSAIVATIFAWHPLRVESVAWISERKDVLFAFFMLLSLLCYASYTRFKPAKKLKVNSELSPFRNSNYWFALLFFILSFMCKGTVVTLPLLFLLLDVWPLQRLNPSTARRLIIEKIPFFMLSVLFSALTFWIHKTHSDVMSVEHSGSAGRIENVILSYVNYLGKFFWPSNLAVIYPYPKSFDGMEVLFAALALLAISVICILQLSRRPWLAAGWFWYLLAMLPVIGFVQVGSQAMADRHTYISLIGPAVSLVWLGAEWARTKWLQKALPSMAAAVCALCVILTEKQLQLWQNTVTLFNHTVAVTPENALAEFPLAMGLQAQGLIPQAAVHYRMALAMHPDNMHYLANYYLADILWHYGHYHEAETNMQASAEINPENLEAVNAFAWMLAACPDASARDGARAVQVAKNACEESHYQTTRYVGTLAAAYAEAGRFDDAIATAQKAIALAQQYGQTDLAERNEQLLEVYQSHQAYHETPATAPVR